MFIRCCLVKFTVKQTILEFKRKTILTSILRKTNANIGAKILKQQRQSIASQVTCEVLSNVKDPMNYQDRAVHKYEQKPIDFKIDNSNRPTMVNINENVQKKRVEKRKMLEKQLSKNTIKMKKLKANKV